jgi:phosphoribosylglycinamide formyltransferase-1
MHNIRMAKTSSRDKRLTHVTKIARSLPEVKRELHGSHATFLVGKKPFAYYLDNHHGDGIVGITCKVLPGENQSLVEAQPERFYPPAYLASRGWVALRLDRGKIDWQEVQELLLGSYAMIAPKRLAEKAASDL